MSRPWMPLYVADYLADTGHLSTVEHGAYMLLIMHYWQKGGLPNDPKRLASIARASLEQWLEIEPTLIELFGVDWTHARIDEELAKSAKAYEKRALAGSRGGLAKASNATAMLQQNPSNALPSTITLTKKVSSSSRGKRVTEADEIEVEFESTFWPAYPRKVDKKDALKAFRASRKTIALSVVMSALGAYCREVKGKEAQYIRHAARWLHAENWTPEINAAPVVVGDDGKWPQRLLAARQHKAWSIAEWGPPPGHPECRAPPELLKPGDGEGWREWQKEAA